jgi:predicted RNA-binding protein
MPTRTEIIESPSGRGRLYHEGTFVAEVVYSLSVTQKIHGAATFGDPEAEVEGLRDITGRIDLDSHQAGALLGENLVLELSDGRRLPIYILNQRGLIQARGWFGDE